MTLQSIILYLMF